MADLAFLIDDLVAANRILARENVVDAFGHVSVRHPGASGSLFPVPGAFAATHRG